MSNDLNINRCQYIAMWYAGIPIFMVVINTVYVYIYIYQVHINTRSIPRLLRLAGDRTRWKRGDRSHQTTRGDRRWSPAALRNPRHPEQKEWGNGKSTGFQKKKKTSNLSMYGWSLEQVAWNMFGTWDIKLCKETEDDDVDMSWVNNKSRGFRQPSIYLPIYLSIYIYACIYLYIYICIDDIQQWLVELYDWLVAER